MGEKGFTIVELLVVLGVVSIISAITFTTLKKGGETLALDRSAHQVAQDMRRTGQMALRGEPFICPTGSMVGYGIYFNRQTPSCYLIYAECDDKSFYDGIDCRGGGGGPDRQVERIDLEQGVRIQGLWPPGFAGEALFIPPQLTVQINGNDDPGARLRVTLSLTSDSTITKTITITQKGTVEIQ